MNVDWVEAGPEDRTFLRALFDERRGAMFAALPGEMQESLLEMQWRAREAGYRQVRPFARWLVVRADGERAGELVLDESGPIHIVDFAIAPQARRRGIGTAVLQRLQGIAEERNQFLTLEVEPESAARSLYARLGFVEIGASEVHVAMSWSPDSGTKSPNHT